MTLKLVSSRGGTGYEARGRKVDAPKYPPLAFSIEAKAGDVGEIVLYGVIGSIYEGITAKQFDTDIRKVESVKTLNIRINSPGGYVSEGRTIFNRLKQHKARKVVYIDGEACSIASLIAMAGDEVRMAEGTHMLVHRAWGITIGNVGDHAKTIRDLEMMDAAMVETYAARTGMSKKDVLSLMEEDRYMDAREAVAKGFADVADGAQKMAALAVNRADFNLPELPLDARPNRAAAMLKIAAMRGK